MFVDIEVNHIRFDGCTCNLKSISLTLYRGHDVKKHFPGFFAPTQAEFQSLWSSATFSPDANVLLNLYRYRSDTRDRFVSVFQRIKSRLWITNQAAQEFLRNRVNVIESQRDAFDRVIDELQKSKNELSGRLSEFSKHSAIDVKELSAKVGASLEEAAQEIKKLRSSHPDLLQDDPILKIIGDIFDGRVGDAIPKGELPNVYKAIDERYSKGIPPGYADKTKPDGRAYGDCLVWLQLIDQARRAKTAMIFLTDDLKDDWWLRHKGRTLGPRPELVAEMMEEAGASFYMYSPESFLEHAASYFKERVDKAVIKDVRTIRDRAMHRAEVDEDDIAKANQLIERVGRKDVVIRHISEAIGSLQSQMEAISAATRTVSPMEREVIELELQEKGRELESLKARLQKEQMGKRALMRRIESFFDTEIERLTRVDAGPDKVSARSDV